HARRGRAGSRRLPQGLLRQARPQVPNLRTMACLGRTHPEHPHRALTSEGAAMISLLSFINARRASSLAKASVAAAALVLAVASAANAQQSFKSADEAAEALVNAAKAGNRKALLTVLGSKGEDIVSSGDAVADDATRKEFLAAYDAKHQVAMEGD